MMLSPSFSGTTVWHTARRVRNSCMHGAVGYRHKARRSSVKTPLTYSRVRFGHPLLRARYWLSAPFRTQVEALAWTPRPPRCHPLGGSCSPPSSTSSRSPLLGAPPAGLVRRSSDRRPPVPLLLAPSTCSQPVLTHPLCFHSTVNSPEKSPTTRLGTSFLTD